MSTFASLGIQKGYVKSLKELNITTPTAIQEKAIPVLLKSNTDFVGLAQTGTGKTAAFGLPVLHKIDSDKNEIQALILSPTRELVQQIKKQLFKFTKYIDTQIFAEAVYGGEKIDKQLARLERTTHIIVATPGRLADFIKRGDINLKNVKTVVLDEADEMLSMGFKQELDYILKHTQGERNTWLFSATMPAGIQQIVNNYMNPKAVHISVKKENQVNENISHSYIRTSINGKLDMLMQVLESRGDERGIIFCKTKAGAQKLKEQLNEEGYAVDALEGNMKQKERDKVMRAFKNESLQFLISTDVAARGIDVHNLGFVIHHQLPEHIEYYTHRSGRTARAGKKGDSIAFILPNEMEDIVRIQKALNITFQDRTL